MNVEIRTAAGITYLEGIPGRILIDAERDAVDLVGLCGAHEAARVMLHGENVSPRFFDLRTQLAGLVLQKFVNYGVKLALVLNHDDRHEGRFRDMEIEANRGRHFSVFYDRTQAESWLVRT
jgi:PadR family transcriptional regulator, regulatory protein AphA